MVSQIGKDFQELELFYNNFKKYSENYQDALVNYKIKELEDYRKEFDKYLINYDQVKYLENLSERHIWLNFSKFFMDQALSKLKGEFITSEELIFDFTKEAKLLYRYLQLTAILQIVRKTDINEE